MKKFYSSQDGMFHLLFGDTMEILPRMGKKFDMVFADPPYFLSNNGLTVVNGKVASVNKGTWDKSGDYNFVNSFNRQWLSAIRNSMKEDATIWVSGTFHNIFSVGQAMLETGFKIINVVTWEKTNPPPNFSCRYFTHSAEQIIWAKKHSKAPHFYNYDIMKRLNHDRQMKDVWRLSAIAPWEKSCGKHPTQKPLSVLARIVLASTRQDAWVLDPFAGSSTTGIAANLLGRNFVGIDKEVEFLEISKNRKKEIESDQTAAQFRRRILPEFGGFNIIFA